MRLRFDCALAHTLRCLGPLQSVRGPGCERRLGRPQKPVLVDAMEMTRFHTDDYVDFLRTVTPDNMHDHLRSLKR